MRYAVGHKDQTSKRILRAAGKLFRKQGYAATGVDRVMASAHLTAGAFYAHFRSKQDLLAKALDNVFVQGAKERPAELSELRGRPWLRAFASFYLSDRHRKGTGKGCPMPALAAEVGRVGGKPRAVFEQHLQRVIESVAQQFDEADPDRQRAIATMAMCVGGVTLARAVKSPGFAQEILQSCREAALQQFRD